MRTLALILVFSPILLVDAQDKKPEPKKKPDPKTWMCKRGELLWEEKFEDGKWSKEWNKYKGNFVVEGDAVKSNELAADGHHPAMSRRLGGDNNVIVQFSFKSDGSPWLGFALDDKENDWGPGLSFGFGEDALVSIGAFWARFPDWPAGQHLPRFHMLADLGRLPRLIV